LEYDIKKIEKTTENQPSVITMPKRLLQYFGFVSESYVSTTSFPGPLSQRVPGNEVDVSRLIWSINMG